MSYKFDARGAFLPKFLGFIMVLFIGILILTYAIARKVDPVILDEQGHVRGGGQR
jgi:hypothetical protein